MARIIRGARFVDEHVVIGEPAALPAPARFRPTLPPPPPPPPPPVEPIVDLWSEPSDDNPLNTGALTFDDSPGPSEAEVAERLAEAEHFLVLAQAEADEIRGAAQREAEELTAQAQDSLERAREQAASIAEDATEAAERARLEATEAGHREGFDRGHLEGIARAEEEMSGRVAELTRLVESAAVDRRELLRNAEAEVVRLALLIARKVIQMDVQTDPSIVTRIAEAALQQVSVNGLIRLRVHPEQYSTLSAYWARGHGATEAERAYEIDADPAVESGGIIIDTRAGVVDAQISTQLDEIARVLTESEPAVESK